MTEHKIKVLPDGTRVYSNYTRYKPKTKEQRIYGVNKPDHPEAVMFNSLWFVPMELLPDEARVKPETRPDSEAVGHRKKCRCNVCKRPEARIARRRAAAKARRQMRISSMTLSATTSSTSAPPSNR